MLGDLKRTLLHLLRNAGVLGCLVVKLAATGEVDVASSRAPNGRFLVHILTRTKRLVCVCTIRPESDEETTF